MSSDDRSENVGRIWRELYGPSQETVWLLLADEIKGTFSDGWTMGKRVDVSHGPWVITLDSYKVGRPDGSSAKFTRMRAPFVNPSGFRFTIVSSGPFKEFFVKLGVVSDIKIGIEKFDRKYIVQSNSELQIQQLLASEAVRDQIEAQPEIRLTVQDDDGAFRQKFPDNVDALHFEVRGLVRDLPRLRGLYDLFCRTLERLCDMGLVPLEDPNVKL